MQSLPLLGISGYSGSGKTTLLEKLIPLLNQKGIRVGVIKHSHHSKAQVDKKGKDSWRMKEAGANQVALATDESWALMTKTPTPITLQQLAEQFSTVHCDLILVEGFKQEPIPKILIHRQGLEKPCPQKDAFTLGFATDYPKEDSLNLNNVKEIADFIEKWFKA